MRTAIAAADERDSTEAVLPRCFMFRKQLGQLLEEQLKKGGVGLRHGVLVGGLLCSATLVQSGWRKPNNMVTRLSSTTSRHVQLHLIVSS